MFFKLFKRARSAQDPKQDILYWEMFFLTLVKC